MRDDLLTRLDRVIDYFVKEGLGFDDRCVAVEEAKYLIGKYLRYECFDEIRPKDYEEVPDRRIDNG